MTKSIRWENVRHEHVYCLCFGLCITICQTLLKNPLWFVLMFLWNVTSTYLRLFDPFINAFYSYSHHCYNFTTEKEFNLSVNCDIFMCYIIIHYLSYIVKIKVNRWSKNHVDQKKMWKSVTLHSELIVILPCMFKV